MELISLDEFKDNDIYEDFINKNPQLGSIKIQVYTAQIAIPIEDAQITIYKDIGEYDVMFYRGKTNLNGIIDNIYLPAPTLEKVSKLEDLPYAQYIMEIKKEGYKPIYEHVFNIFAGTKSIQNIELSPLINIE